MHLHSAQTVWSWEIALCLLVTNSKFTPKTASFFRGKLMVSAKVNHGRKENWNEAIQILCC